MKTKPAPPAWLVTWCELHSATKLVYDREDSPDEWTFEIRGIVCCYLSSWTFEQFVSSMEAYV